MFKESIAPSKRVVEEAQEKNIEKETVVDTSEDMSVNSSQEKLTALREADDRKTQEEMNKIREKLGIKSSDEKITEVQTESNERIARMQATMDNAMDNNTATAENESMSRDSQESVGVNNEMGEEMPKEHELEYQLAQEALNLIKESFDSAVFENGGEVNTTNIESILEAELKARPLNCDLYQGDEYDEDRFLDDTIRVPELGMVIEVAHSEMEAKLEFVKEQKIKSGDENAESWHKEEMKKLWDGYKKAEDKLYNELIFRIDSAHDPEGAEERRRKDE